MEWVIGAMCYRLNGLKVEWVMGQMGHNLNVLGGMGYVEWVIG